MKIVSPTISALAIAVFGFFTLDFADAQIVQLPTVRVFRVNTTVSVPDGGSIRLGSTNRHREQSIRRGVSGLPGPLFNNRGVSRDTNASRATVSAKLIIMSEYEQEVLAEARKRRLTAQASDPNGSPEVQAQADFISQNIGRTRRK